MSPHCTAVLPPNAYEILGDGTARIDLTQGKSTIVNMCDLKTALTVRIVAQRTKSGAFYAMAIPRRTARSSRYIGLHRFLLQPSGDVLVDHRDGDGLNNQRFNLRIATRSLNGANSRISVRNKSGFKGVSWTARRGSWEAVICVNKQNRFLGYFITPEAAARAYDDAARSAFGEFAAVNFAAEGERAA